MFLTRSLHDECVSGSSWEKFCGNWKWKNSSTRHRGMKAKTSIKNRTLKICVFKQIIQKILIYYGFVCGVEWNKKYWNSLNLRVYIQKQCDWRNANDFVPPEICLIKYLLFVCPKFGIPSDRFMVYSKIEFYGIHFSLRLKCPWS